MEDSGLKETALNNVFILYGDGSRKLLTKNLVPGMKVNDEKLITIANEEYRIWEPFRSKLAVMIMKGSSFSVKNDTSFLYLGAANGTTVSYISDIVTEGIVFAVEISPRAMKDLIRISIPRKNLIPILADAMDPGSYKNMVTEVDILYQDIAQREQANISIRNAQFFLKKNGILVLIIKAKSIDSIKRSKDLIGNEIEKLEDFFKVEELFDLEPFHSDHMAVIARKIC
jgi:fibrillarin-like pre-rRNA processing protein